MTVQLLLNALPGNYAVSRCAPDLPVPDWVQGPGLVSVTQAPDETSILCRADRVPDTVRSEVGWRAVQVCNVVDLDVPGVVLAAVRPISEAGLGIFVTSTFDRDYILVRQSEEEAAQAAWIRAGHSVVSNGVTYRLAGPEDCEALSFLHFNTWQETYASIAPPEVRLQLNLKRRRSYWAERLERTCLTLLAEKNGKVIGLCALSAPEVPESDLEIVHLYVDKEERQAGLGRHFLGLASAVALQLRLNGVVLAVVQENLPAIEFYRRNGGTVVAQMQDEGPLWKSENLIFRWETARVVL